MSTQLAVKLSDEEMASIDDLVAREVAPTRSAVLHLALAQLTEAERRRLRREQDLAAYAAVPDTDDDDGADWSNLKRTV
jgi:Arc/MetJ-type ribon-helix-helix transcriptional regulator